MILLKIILTNIQTKKLEERLSPNKSRVDLSKKFDYYLNKSEHINKP